MNIPSVKQLQQMYQPIFKDSKGKPQTYGNTSKKDLIRIAYVYSKEAQKFMQGMELFKTKYSALLLLSECDCKSCSTSLAEYAELIKNEEEEDG